MPGTPRLDLALSRRLALGLAAAVCLFNCQDPGGQSVGPASAQVVEAAASADPDRVRIKSSSELGVPLHPALKSSRLSGRIPNGSEVTVLRYSADRSWLEVRAAGGERGWISARYLAGPSTRVGTEAAPPDSVWASPQRCKAMYAAGNRLAKDPSRVRVGSWNIRWFPDGGPGSAKQPTDVEWLACGIAWLGADLLAVQEFKRGSSDPATKRLLSLLRRDTGSTWKLLLDDCPKDDRQHVGALYNADRLSLTRLASEPEVNPKGNSGQRRVAGSPGCEGRLRPGFGASVRHVSGLDFEVVVLHLKSGTRADDYKLRRRSLSGLGQLLGRRTQAASEQDVLVLGDWNSMGCDACAPRASAADERAVLAAELSASGLRLLSAGCTEYYRGKPGALDHVALSRSMAEAASAEIQVSGFCAESKCAPLSEPPKAQQALSDHCPVLVDLQAVDLD